MQNAAILNPHDVVDGTMSALLIKQTFWASIRYSLVKELIFDPLVPTACTDEENVWFGPWFVDLPNIKQRVFVLCHELAHCMFGDCAAKRRFLDAGIGPDGKPFDAQRFDHACDYRINAMLVEDKIGEMPPNGLLDPRYTADMTAVQIYLMLPQSDSGSGGGKGFDEHKPGKQMSPEEAEARKLQVGNAIAKAAQAAQAAGKMPGSLKRLIDEILHPRKPWQEILKDSLTVCAGRDELSWARIRRRSLALAPHIPYPGRSGHTMECLVVAVDVSGSIGGEEYGLFLGALDEIVEQIRPEELWAIFWDTQARAVQIESLDDIRGNPPIGGGGTDYTCVPKEIARLGLNPDAVVCLTDAYATWPDAKEIPWPHITVSTTKEKCPFGRTIEMTESR